MRRILLIVASLPGLWVIASAIPKSPDGRYWRCHLLKDGVKKARCLIVPEPST